MAKEKLIKVKLTARTIRAILLLEEATLTSGIQAGGNPRDHHRLLSEFVNATRNYGDDSNVPQGEGQDVGRLMDALELRTGERLNFRSYGAIPGA